jgi:A/G-specific adenine glycosylase
MLQQTRVEAVIPYFERFLRLFPTLPDLARASLPRVLKVWAGLGYYARARNLHAAARIICRDLGGKIPAGKEALLKLPGFGPYTAGAVASLAFNQPVAALDGNVKRVLSRLYGTGSPAWANRKEEAEKFLEGLIPPGRASDFNQALMDLGAMICIPRQPRCRECAVRRWCSSRGAGPKKQPAARRFRKEIWAVALVEKDGRVLLHRKEGKGLLAGLWQFPVVVVGKDHGAQGISAEKKALQADLKKNFGVRVKIQAPFAQQEYFFTHIHASMKPYLCDLGQKIPGGLSSKVLRWVKPNNFSRYPMSTAMRRIAALLKSIAKD